MTAVRPGLCCILPIVFSILCRCHAELSFENAHEAIIIIAAALRDIGQQKRGRGQQIFCTVQSAFLQIPDKVHPECLNIYLVKIRLADIQFLTAYIAAPVAFGVDKNISAEFEEFGIVNMARKLFFGSFVNGSEHILD